MLDPLLDQLLVLGAVGIAVGYLGFRFFWRRRKASGKACDVGCCVPAKGKQFQKS